MDVGKTLQQLSTRITAWLPYPLALQGLVWLSLVATPIDALSITSITAPAFWGLLGLLLLDLLLCTLLPIRRLRVWQQIACLLGQCGLVALAHLLLPAPLLSYVFLMIVLQAVYLLRVWQWVIFAGLVWLIWNGSLIMGSTSLPDWLGDNLAIVFPATCMLIAAVTYARQHRRLEQVQQMLQQLQRHYDALTLGLRDAQQRAALEERRRLTQTITSDISAALAATEQSVVAAISHAQTNLARLEATVAQTRAAAGTTIERLRQAVDTLRGGERDQGRPIAATQPPALPADGLLTARAQAVLTWLLPLVFVGLAVPLALLQHPIAPVQIVLALLCCLALLLACVLTQRVRRLPLVHVGLASQTGAVLGLVLLTQTLPLLLGLLLVMWQIALRFSAGQIVTFLAGTQIMIGLVLLWLFDAPSEYSTNLLFFCLACASVAGLLGMARRQLSSRREHEVRVAQLARLNCELELQETEVRALAVATERSRLAREFHDDLGHQLMLISMQLQLAEALLEEDPGEALRQLFATREQLQLAWQSVVSAAADLRPIDGAALASALESLVEHCRQRLQTKVVLQMTGDLAGLMPAVACAIYRAAQEGLTNACKYAQASRIEVLVCCGERDVTVCVRDDGRGETGYARLSTASLGRFGLRGLHERVAPLGGHVEAGPQPDGGFALQLHIPLGEAT